MGNRRCGVATVAGADEAGVASTLVLISTMESSGIADKGDIGCCCGCGCGSLGAGRLRDGTFNTSDASGTRSSVLGVFAGEDMIVSARGDGDSEGATLFLGVMLRSNTSRSSSLNVGNTKQNNNQYKKKKGFSLSQYKPHTAADRPWW